MPAAQRARSNEPWSGGSTEVLTPRRRFLHGVRGRLPAPPEALPLPTASSAALFARKLALTNRSPERRRMVSSAQLVLTNHVFILADCIPFVNPVFKFFQASGQGIFPLRAISGSPGTAGASEIRACSGSHDASSQPASSSSAPVKFSPIRGIRRRRCATFAW